MILGFDLEITRVMLVAVLGGLLGILMMIPLRRALIVEAARHPEVPRRHRLRRGAEGRRLRGIEAAASPPRDGRSRQRRRGRGAPTGAKTIFTGFGIGFVYKTAMEAFKVWKDTPEKIFGAPFKAGSIAAEISPELLGVGYIIGPRIASIMCAGGVLAYLVLIPAIKFFGARPDRRRSRPARCRSREMAPGRDPRRLRALHRRRRGGGRRHHQPVPLAADDLARLKGGLRGLRATHARPQRRAAAAHRPGPADEVRGLSASSVLVAAIMLSAQLRCT